MNPSGGWRCTFTVIQQVQKVFIIHINVPLHSRWQTQFYQLASNQRPRDTSDIVHLAACMVQASLTDGQSLLPLVDNTNTTCLHFRSGRLVHQQVTIYKFRSTHPSILHCTNVKSGHFHCFPPAISTPEKENTNSIDQIISTVSSRSERRKDPRYNRWNECRLVHAFHWFCPILGQMPKMPYSINLLWIDI